VFEVREASVWVELRCRQFDDLNSYRRLLWTGRQRPPPRRPLPPARLQQNLTREPVPAGQRLRRSPSRPAASVSCSLLVLFWFLDSIPVLRLSGVRPRRRSLALPPAPPKIEARQEASEQERGAAFASRFRRAVKAEGISERAHGSSISNICSSLRLAGRIGDENPLLRSLPRRTARRVEHRSIRQLPSSTQGRSPRRSPTFATTRESTKLTSSLF
jgi:hypothetical protein